MTDAAPSLPLDWQSSPAHLAAIVASSNDAIISKTLDGRIRSWNGAAERLFGHSAAQAVGQNITLIVPPELLEEERQILDKLRRGERIEHFETTRMTRDGRRVRVSLTVSPIRDVHGRVVGASKIARDIEVQRHIEHERAHLAALVASSEDVIVSKSLDGFIQSWNPAAERLFGYPAGEAIGRHITMIIPPELHAEENQILERVRRGEHVEHFDTIRVTRDGARVPMSLTVSPIRNNSGRIVGASKIGRNITERVRTEQALREEARRLEILNGVSRELAAAQLDLARVVQIVTDAGTQLSGAQFGAFFYNVLEGDGRYRLYTLSGAPRSAFEHFPMPRITALFKPTFGGEGVVRVDDIGADPRYGQSAPHHGMPPGHLPVRSYLAAPVISGSGEVLGGLFFGHADAAMFSDAAEHLIVGIAGQAAVAIDNARLHEASTREIARRVQVEQALNDADRRKDEFLALLAHELRNPLAPIRFAVELRRKDVLTPEQQIESNRVIGRQVEHMSRLLDDLLDVSRITHGTLELRRSQVELAAVIATAIESARPILDSKGHRLAVDLPRVPVGLEADPVRLAQILSNLLINAAKYTDPGGEIALAVTHSGDDLEVIVRDNGIGIDADMMPRLFTLFSQARSAVERSEGGLGIGLALVKGLVDLHGGSIRADSAGLGQGSQFSVRLPVREVPVPPPRAPALDEPVAALEIIVADDNEDVAESCALLLRLGGHRVHVAHNGRQAFELAEQIHPQILLLDIGMPDGNGYELARRIRATKWGEDVALIAITGWGQEDDRERSRQAGFDRHCIKPIDPEVLQSMIGELAHRRSGAAS